MTESRISRRGLTIGRLIFLFLLAVLITFLVLVLLVSPPARPRWVTNRLLCQTSLRTLSAALRIYASEHGHAFPAPDRWCDAVDELIAAPEKSFRCPGGGQGRCHYAMNPYADPCGPDDLVLLFESAGGWNQSGGPELLTTAHHEGEGCHVAFVNGHVDFVKTAELDRLKWRGETVPGAPNARRPGSEAELEYWDAWLAEKIALTTLNAAVGDVAGIESEF